MGYPVLPRVIAHRGGGLHAPENTLEGLALAAREGFRAVEFDVRLARCGTPMLLHDATLNRTTTATGRLRDWTRTQLGALTPGVSIPTLAEAALACRTLGLLANVEIKADPGDEAEAGRIVGLGVVRLWSETAPGVVISSFAEAALVACAAAAPNVARGLLVETVPDDWRAAMARARCAGLHAGIRALDDATVADIVASGIPLLVYTVNDADRARRLLAAGATSIVTDRVDASFAVL